MTYLVSTTGENALDHFTRPISKDGYRELPASLRTASSNQFEAEPPNVEVADVYCTNGLSAIFLLSQIPHHRQAEPPFRPEFVTKAWFAVFLLSQIAHHYVALQPAGFCDKSLVRTFTSFPKCRFLDATSHRATKCDKSLVRASSSFPNRLPQALAHCRLLRVCEPGPRKRQLQTRSCLGELIPPLVIHAEHWQIGWSCSHRVGSESFCLNPGRLLPQTSQTRGRFPSRQER